MPACIFNNNAATFLSIILSANKRSVNVVYLCTPVLENTRRINGIKWLNNKPYIVHFVAEAAMR